jgi:hypothetical protein
LETLQNLAKQVQMGMMPFCTGAAIDYSLALHCPGGEWTKRGKWKNRSNGNSIPVKALSF